MTTPEDQYWLFPDDCVALAVICEDFERMYPGIEYYLKFERNPLCD